MKSAFVLGPLFLSSLAAAGLIKRDIVYETVTEEVYETVVITTTVWVKPTPAAVDIATSNQAAFYEQTKSLVHHHSSVYSPPPPPSSPAAPPPASTPAYTPPPAPPAPPSSVYTPPPAPPSTPVYTPPAENTPTPANPAGPSRTGDLTWYDTGTGSCGIVSGPDDKIVALSHFIMDPLNPGNPNNNPMCGKTVTINYGGQTHTATVVDTCEGCAEGDLDLSHGFFNLVTNYGDGRVHGATWTVS